jgi:hypothetical protein
MAVYILEPSLTDDFIVTIFTNLVRWETKKLIGLDMEHQEGCQTGYLECLADLFGEANDDDVNAAFDKGETWLQVVNTIMDIDDLKNLVNSMSEQARNEGLEAVDLEGIEETVEIVVDDFLVTNMDIARKAVRNI